MAMSGAATPARPPVVLSCTVAVGVPVGHVAGICDAVQTRLADQTTHPVLQITRDMSHPETNAALWLYLPFPAGHATQLTIRPGWRLAGPKTGPKTHAPEMSFGVTDTSLVSRFYDRFAHQRVQPLPLFFTIMLCKIRKPKP